MSTDYCVYVGSYIKIQEPLVTVKASQTKCEKCGMYFSSKFKFCPLCGNKTILLKKQGRQSNIYEILEQLDEKYFKITGQLQSHDDGFVCIGFNIETALCVSLNCFESVDEEFEIPEKPDDSVFDDLVKLLKENNLPYEIKHGIVCYAM